MQLDEADVLLIKANREGIPQLVNLFNQIMKPHEDVGHGGEKCNGSRFALIARFIHELGYANPNDFNRIQEIVIEMSDIGGIAVGISKLASIVAEALNNPEPEIEDANFFDEHKDIIP